LAGGRTNAHASESEWGIFWGSNYRLTKIFHIFLILINFVIETSAPPNISDRTAFYALRCETLFCFARHGFA
jgi:hypothetical protein